MKRPGNQPHGDAGRRYLVAERIAWGILGNASIARSCVIPAVQNSRNGFVHALATRDPGGAQEIAAVHKIRHLYGSYQELLADPHIDVVYNPLPNHLHHRFTLNAVRQGKHVLCEKPLACCADEAREMVAAAAHGGLLLMESWSYRFHPRSLKIKEMIRGGVIGKPALLRTAFCFHLGDALLGGGETARLNPEMGGGALLDVGCYGVSVARWLLDLEPTMAQSQAVYHHSGVDLHTVGSLRFPGDILATVEASFITALQQTYTVVGSEGVIELPHDAFIPWEKESFFTLRGKEDETGDEQHIEGADGYQLMVEHFADAVLGKTELAFLPKDSVCNMEALDALALAAKTGSTLDIIHS